MNDILTLTNDEWDEIADDIPDDWEGSADSWFWEKFNLKFITFLRTRPGGFAGKHLYKITDPALYTAFLLRYS